MAFKGKTHSIGRQWMGYRKVRLPPRPLHPCIPGGDPVTLSPEVACCILLHQVAFEGAELPHLFCEVLESKAVKPFQGLLSHRRGTIALTLGLRNCPFILYYLETLYCNNIRCPSEARWTGGEPSSELSFVAISVLVYDFKSFL